MRKLKNIGRSLVCRILEWQVVQLRKRHDFKVVAVAGSAGKTSTKMAIARVLSASRRVRWQEGNYNDRVTVPLIFFGQSQPNILNIFAWLRIFIQNQMALSRPYPFDVVVVELGTDGPGFIKEFVYIKPDLAVVTAVAHEHMEFFGTLDAVAKEELGVMNFSAKTLVNVDDTSKTYLKSRTYFSYGFDNAATYHIRDRKEHGLDGQTLELGLAAEKHFKVDIPMLGRQGAKIALAAAASAHLLGVPAKDIKNDLSKVSAFAGRMQVLSGVKNSTIIDDTYNASPVAVKAALDVLYSGDAPQRIAVLGSMNELGEHSSQAHTEVGEYCDPKKLDLIVTIGRDAQNYLAPIAKKRGCRVESFLNPYEAGQFVRDNLEKGAVILAKGSQNRVFAEESLKILLANKKDHAKLVRQSTYWMRIKSKQFRP